MGTRGLTCAVIGGEMKVAQYGQWDHYPGGQGSTIAHFLDCVKLVKLEEALRECKFVPTEELQKRVDQMIPGIKDGWMDSDQAETYNRYFPELSRDTGGDIFKLILFDGKRELQDSSSFAGDSLFCEWAYVLDCDRDVLEVYKGFQDKGSEVKGRFKDISARDSSGYGPVTLIKEIPFSKVVEGMAELIEELNKESENEE